MCHFDERIHRWKKTTLSFAEWFKIECLWLLEDWRWLKNCIAEFNLLVTSINFTRKSSLGCQKRMYPSLLACPVWFCKTFAWNLTPRGKIYPFMVMAYWPGKIRRLILYMHCGQEFGHLLGKKLLNWNWWCNCCFRFHFFDDRQFVVYKTARIHAHFRNEIHLKSRIHVFDLHISSCFLLKRVF